MTGIPQDLRDKVNAFVAQLSQKTGVDLDAEEVWAELQGHIAPETETGTKDDVPQCCSGKPDHIICCCLAHWHPHRRGPECGIWDNQPTKEVDNERE